jgi:integrase
MSCLRAQTPPLATASCINLLIHLRSILQELAWTQPLPELAHMIRRQDVPRLPKKLPRSLTAQQDQLLDQEFLRRNDLGGNAFLLIRHTGMRIGECADLFYDCLRSTGPDQWAVHVPLGKLQKERMVPVDRFVCELVQRLRFFRSLDPRPADGLLLARPSTKHALVRQLRDYLHQVCHSLGLSTRLVPHQLRHTYATQMIRSGVGFPALMTLLGHTSPDMTMRYVEVALTAASSTWRAPSPGIWFPSPKPHSPRFEPASTASSTPCSPLNMCSKCSVAPCPTVPHALRSPGSPTALPKSSPKHANSHHPDSGHRLAGYVDQPYTIEPRIPNAQIIHLAPA